MLEFTTNTEAAPVEREDLFSLGGATYTIPVSFSAGETLTYVDGLRKYGPDMAASWALEMALGEDGYRALLGAPEHVVPKQDFARLVTVITSRLLGQESPVPGGPKVRPAAPKPRKPRGSKDSTSQ